MTAAFIDRAHRLSNLISDVHADAQTLAAQLPDGPRQMAEAVVDALDKVDEAFMTAVIAAPMPADLPSELAPVEVQ